MPPLARLETPFGWIITHKFIIISLMCYINNYLGGMIVDIAYKVKPHTKITRKIQSIMGYLYLVQVRLS